jgi:hypothetical protein
MKKSRVAAAAAAPSVARRRNAAAANPPVFGLRRTDAVLQALIMSPAAMRHALRVAFLILAPKRVTLFEGIAFQHGTLRCPPWAAMPVDVIAHVFSFLPPRTHLTRLEHVRRSWRTASLRGPGFQSIEDHSHAFLRSWSAAGASGWLHLLGSRINGLRLLQTPLRMLHEFVPRFASKLQTLLLSIASSYDHVGGDIDGHPTLLSPCLVHLKALAECVALHTLSIRLEHLYPGLRSWHFHIPKTVTSLRLDIPNTLSPGDYGIAFTAVWPDRLRSLAVSGQWVIKSLPRPLYALERCFLALGHECAKNMRQDWENAHDSLRAIAANTPALRQLVLQWADATTYTIVSTMTTLTLLAINTCCHVDSAEATSLSQLTSLGALRSLRLVVTRGDNLTVEAWPMLRELDLTQSPGIAPLHVRRLLSTCRHLERLDLTATPCFPEEARRLWRAAQFPALLDAISPDIVQPEGSVATAECQDTDDTEKGKTP